MLLRRAVPFLGVLTSLLLGGSAIDLDINSEKSINDAASTAITNALTYYDPNIGRLIRPKYFWWELGALLGVLVQRWSITGNNTLNKFITDNTLAQIGEDKNFAPESERLELGNDDQAFYAFTVLDMAEYGFPDPPDGQPSWIGLAQSVFNDQTSVWDPATCGGGMRWQKFKLNKGFDYKNLPTNAGYFMISARLARYTTNTTYAEKADRMWDWIEKSPMWQEKDGNLTLYDGTHVKDCNSHSAFDPSRYTYNVGMLLNGAAYMYDFSTGADKDKWKTRIDTLMTASNDFFVAPLGANANNAAPKQASGNVMGELQCEFIQPQSCNRDMPAFKGFLTRWLSTTIVLAPWLNETIWPRLVAGAQGAAQQCTGTSAAPEPAMIPGTACGRRWYQTTFDGQIGVGEQMSAASAFQALNIMKAKKPFTSKKGGTSKSDPGLGAIDTRPGAEEGEIYVRDITTGDKAGAAILTIAGMLAFLAGGVWMVMD